MGCTESTDTASKKRRDGGSSQGSSGRVVAATTRVQQRDAGGGPAGVGRRPSAGHGDPAGYAQPSSGGRTLQGGGGGRVLGGSEPTSDAATMAAHAAIRRQETKTIPGFSRESSAVLNDADPKPGLIAEINGICAQLTQDPPFGLAAATAEQLAKHRDYLRARLNDGRKR